MCHAAIAQSSAAGSVADNDRVLGAGYFLVIERDGLHQPHRVDALL
jgi:hypothetical protein